MWGKHPPYTDVHVNRWREAQSCHLITLAEIKLRESSMNPERSERIEIPVLPLRDVVVYPHMVIPLICRAGKIYPLSGSGDGP